MFDWSDLRYFLEVHRAGGVASAGRRLGVNQTTVMRRLQALEQAIGSQLIERAPGGHRLTSAGLKLLPHAEEIENISLKIEADVSGEDAGIAGTVRIGVTEGLGSCFLAPRLAKLVERLPDIAIELVSVPRFVNLTNREADIAIGQEPPSAGQLIIKKLTDYTLKLYASPSYLEQHDVIRSKQDLVGHSFIGYVDDLLYSKELEYLSRVCEAPHIAIRSTSIIAQQRAAIAGAGIAILPSFMVADDADLCVVLPNDIELTLSYWMTTRRELLDLKRVRAVWAYLSELVKENRCVMLQGII